MCIYLRLGVFDIVNFVTVVPILRLLGFRVLNLLGRQEVPVFLQTARLHLLVVNPHLVGLIWIEDQCVQVGELVILKGKQKKNACQNEPLLMRYWLFAEDILYFISFHFSPPCLAFNLFLDEVILSLVIENNMDFLGAVAADVRSCMKQILSIDHLTVDNVTTSTRTVLTTYRT